MLVSSGNNADTGVVMITDIGISVLLAVGIIFAIGLAVGLLLSAWASLLWRKK